MRTPRQLRNHFATFFRGGRFEAEMAEEMRVHLELQTAANRAQGMDSEEAHYAAQRQFGGVAQVQERCREQRGWLWLVQIWRDIGFTGRVLLRNRGFAAAVVLSFALCIGANTAIFSMLYALVLRPLPFPRSEQLVEIYNAFPTVGIPKLASNVSQYLTCREAVPSLATVALWRLDDCTLNDGHGPVRLSGALATADFFELLRVQPLLGHFFAADNHAPAADKVVVLTESFWTARFQRDPGVLGRKLRIDGELFEIVGIAPRLLEAFDARVSVIRPLSWKPEQATQQTGYSPQLFGRLGHGATLAGAVAQVVGWERKLHAAASSAKMDFYERTGHALRIDRIEAQRAEPVAPALYLLQAGVLCVLLIGTVNIAHLLLARANARRSELAIRLALGAGGGAIVRQLLVESFLLAGFGAAAGLVLAWVGLGTANRFTAQLLPEASPFGLDAPVLVFALLVTSMVAVCVGLFPVVFLLRGGLAAGAPIQARGISPGRSARAVSGVLLVAQVAFAFVLLTGAGLFHRSFRRAMGTDPGFEARSVISAQIAVPENKEKSFPPRLAESLAQIPGITASLATATPYVLVAPYGVGMPLGAVELRGSILPAETALPSVYYCGVDPSYLDVLHIPVRSGRWFNKADLGCGRVVAVDESFARRYFPAGDAVGGRLVINAAAPQRDEDWLEIVGVVGDVRHNGVEDRSGRPFLYLPFTQMPFYGTMSVLLRTERPLGEVVARLRETVASIDPELPVVAMEPLADTISDSFANRRGILLLLASFAGTALLLSAIGLYGVVAYDVSRRSREIGIRGALGASRAQLAGMILRQGLVRTGAGVAVGAAVAAGLGRFVTSLLFEVTPLDPLVYGQVAAVLGTVALLACWLPARRAARIDPAETLRAE